MCETCGCNQQQSPVITGRTKYGGNFRPEDIIFTGGDTENNRGRKREIEVKENVLGKNQDMAQSNRAFFNAHKILAINLMGSPGSGKTTLITKTIEALKGEMEIYVVEGDQFGSLDADRIRESGIDVIQINTGNGCHLDAGSVGRAIRELPLTENALLIIENVGNLVCPALFDLGEHEKVVVFSVTEGDDKPIKYAPMFHEASICIINKVDLMTYVDFDQEKATSNLQQINHNLLVHTLSSGQGTGMPEWIETLRKKMKSLQSEKHNAHATKKEG